MASPTLKPTTQTSPLIPSKLAKDQTSEPLTSAGYYIIKSLAWSHIGLGAAVLFAPRAVFGLFKFPIPVEMATMARLFGARDVAIGGLLATADDKNLPDGGRREIKKALWASMGKDAIDVCSVAVALTGGHMGKLPSAMLAGGAAVGIGMGFLGLRTV
ncbi:hypothetical protein P280DRAFT_468141 [Massarina eburnea CBS 473.64]|uniref:Uncharacterized protein n=1 Tax=Massarina eburnea CBS 473.64 TaxID=1395130 RepID=A0A6A6S5G5_9PLEO|nr:hypothetical protein P280DRAFT_468141 [Massarina eburnea CBS 473.64]